jgi:antitoxin component of MazEF toxin-antitoxin module
MVVTTWIFQMRKTLTKHGNSYALVIDKALLEILKIKPGTPLDISTDGRVLIVAPIEDQKRRRKFDKALEETNRDYGRMLKRLAES